MSWGKKRRKKRGQREDACVKFFFFFVPAGLVLYWLVNNILSIAQQWQIQRMFERQIPAHGKR